MLEGQLGSLEATSTKVVDILLVSENDLRSGKVQGKDRDGGLGGHFLEHLESFVICHEKLLRG